MEQTTKCLMCRGFTSQGTTFPDIEEGPLFKFLCSFFSIPFSSQTLNLPGISNSEFCNDCKKILTEAMEIEQRLTQLQVEARKIRCHIRSCMTRSYNSSVNEKVSEGTDASIAVGKFFVQCWSDCKVLIPRLGVTELPEYFTKVKTEPEADFSEQIIDDYDDYSPMEDTSWNMSSIVHNEMVDKDRLASMVYESNCQPLNPVSFEVSDMSQNSNINCTTILSEAVVKKKRGRPRKITVAVGGSTCSRPLAIHDELSGQVANPASDAQEVFPRRRGRPRKQTSVATRNTAYTSGNKSDQQDAENSNDNSEEVETLMVEPLIDADLSDANYAVSDDQTYSHNSSDNEDEDDNYSPDRQSHRVTKKRARGNEKAKTVAKYVRKDREYVCKHCNEKFHLARDLRHHLQDLHNVILSSQCTFCGLDFEEKCRLPNQTSDEVPEHPYICGLEGCKRAYKTVKEIRRHHQFKCVENPRNQLGSNKFKCNQCEKSYVHLKALEYHISSIHEKSFKLCCEVCGMGFQLQSQLKNHMISHSSEKPHECGVCKMRFRRKHQLFYHRRQHTGERPFVCEVCGKGFFVREKLKVHCESVHGERQHPCDICGKTFPSKHYLYNHVTITHYGRRKQKRKKVEAEKKVECDSVEASTERADHTEPLMYQELMEEQQSVPSKIEMLIQPFNEHNPGHEPHAVFQPSPPDIL